MSFTPPVRPQLERLPFHDPEMTWSKFETFCLDYVSRRDDVKEAHFYGTAGSTQKGIDIFADMKNGERWAFQCRHWKKITANNVKATVKKATYAADHYVIMMTSDSTTEARDECKNHKQWELWDGRDLAKKVRALDADQARALLDTNFGPVIRREFLGLDSLSAFRSYHTFFHRFRDTGTLFNHNWHLVGRTKELNALQEFVESNNLICILSGKGGIGKTKLIEVFSQKFPAQFPNAELRFLAEGVALSPSTLDELPLRPCVVVVDDAHRFGDLKPLLELASQRATLAAQSATPIPWLKIVLVCRPYAGNNLRGLAQNLAGSSSVVSFPELGRLSHDDVEKLASQALGPKLAIHVTHLARLTRDCPLVTTVGGRLLASGAVSTGLLERSDVFRANVLDRFRDEIVGHMDGCDPLLASRLLDLVSAVAPVRTDELTFIQTMAEFLNTTTPDVLRGLDALEAGGVLIRRGDKLRITPDVLSDHILHRACLTSAGRSTTYGESVLQHFLVTGIGDIVRNLAELDWRFRAAQGQETNVLDEFWRAWNEEFKEAGWLNKSGMLHFMVKLAPLQPKSVLALIELVIKDSANAELFFLLPPLLRIVAYDPSCTSRCLDLLWNLGRNDNRDQNQISEHPMRVLQELASYDIRMGIPSHMNRSSMTACKRWLRKTSVHEHAHSPLDVVDTILSKTSISDFSHSFQVVTQAFVVDPQATRPLRERAIACIRSCINSGQERAIERAIISCENLLSAPIAYNNMSLSDTQLKLWLPEQIESLKLLADAIKALPSPYMLLKAGEILGWHLEHASHLKLRERARAIFLSLPDSFELRLIQSLGYHDRADYARALLQFEVIDSDEGISDETDEEKEKRQDKARHEIKNTIENTRFKQTLDEFLVRYPKPEEGMEILRFYVEETERRGLRSGWAGATRFTYELAKSSKDYAIFVCEAVFSDSDNPLYPACAVMLQPLRFSDHTSALALADRFAQSKIECHQMVAAAVYGNPQWRENLVAEDWPILQQLSQSPFLAVRLLIVGSLHWMQTKAKPLSPDNCAKALNLLFAIDLAASVDLADKWAAFFVGYHPTFPTSALTDAQCRLILDRLEMVPDIDRHHLQESVVALSGRIPIEVVRWLLRRLEHAGKDFKPVPYTHFNNDHHGPNYQLTGLMEFSEYSDLLREIRSSAIGARGHKAFYLPSLFQMVSLDYNAHGLQVLNEWIDDAERDDDKEKLWAVGLLLREAPKGFAYARVTFVARLLSVAQDIDSELLEKIKTDICSSMTKGLIMSTPFEPAPSHVYQRDGCRKIAHRLPFGSIEREFYEAMARDAEMMIKAELKRDEELEDGL